MSYNIEKFIDDEVQKMFDAKEEMIQRAIEFHERHCEAPPILKDKCTRSWITQMLYIFSHKMELKTTEKFRKINEERAKKN